MLLPPAPQAQYVTLILPLPSLPSFAPTRHITVPPPPIGTLAYDVSASASGLACHCQHVHVGLPGTLFVDRVEITMPLQVGKGSMMRWRFPFPSPQLDLTQPPLSDLMQPPSSDLGSA